MEISPRIFPLMLILLLSSSLDVVGQSVGPNQPRLTARIRCELIAITGVQSQTGPTPEITAPNDSTVAQFPRFYGTVMPPGYTGKVWVVVHPAPLPREQPAYWVQPPRTVSRRGTWDIGVQIGDIETPQGHPFEVRAFADFHPTAQPRIGKLGDWPEKAGCESKSVRVRRD